MPRFAAGLKSNYPAVDSLLGQLPSLIVHRPKVFRAYLQHTGMDSTMGFLSLTDFPIVRNVTTPKVSIGDNIVGYAKYPGIGNVIRLRKVFVEQYEALMRADAVWGKDPHGRFLEERRAGSLMDEQNRARLLMESKVLHEMVHWARTMITMLPDPEKPDYGWIFERAAYDKELTATNLALRDYIAVPGNM